MGYAEWKERYPDRAKANWDLQGRKRKKFKDSFKEGGKCLDCGNEDVRVLEWDHVPGRGKKLKSVCQIGKKVMAEEIKKCDLVCANCHKIREWKRRKKLSTSKGV